MKPSTRNPTITVGALTLVASAYGTIHHVPDSYPTIQGAIDAAADSDTVLVRPGTYLEREIDFRGRAITVTGSAPTDSLIVAGTLVDAGGEGTVFYFHTLEDSSSVLQGLSITGGNSPSYDVRGGGITCRPDSSPRIRRCIIRDNVSAHHGGGIRCFLAAPVIEECSIEGNLGANEGGGIHCDWSSPSFRNCAVRNNEASVGGGLSCFWLAEPEIVGCVIDSNLALDRGGGVAWLYDSGGSMRRCVLRGNEAEKGGGGAENQSSPEILECLIEGNLATDGGGFYLDDGEPRISATDLVGNRANHDGGAMRCLASTTLTDCTLIDNSAGSKGGVAAIGVYGNSGSLSMDHCTLVGSRADSRGDVFYAHYAGATLTNCIVWHNGPDQLAEGYGFSTRIEYSDIQGGWPGEGNIDEDPKLCDAVCLECWSRSRLLGPRRLRGSAPMSPGPAIVS
ncbi:MAG: hypothetical protein CME06_05365 [Gemmatimonadetes bacterium]|nr:hypothetical protein [Gemmatimonadota bacterium]